MHHCLVRSECPSDASVRSEVLSRVDAWASRRSLVRLDGRVSWKSICDCHRVPPSLASVVLNPDSHVDAITDWPRTADLARVASFVEEALPSLVSAFLLIHVDPVPSSTVLLDMAACHTVGWRYSSEPYGTHPYCPSTCLHVRVGYRTLERENNEARIDFIRSSLAAWGVLDVVKPIPPSITGEPRARVWTYDVRPPYFVVAHNPTLGSSDIHPELEVGFPPDLPLAGARLQAWIDKMGMTPIRTRLYLGVRTAAYEELRFTLAALHTPWSVLFTARPRLDINPFTDPATLPLEAPDWIPLRNWHVRRRLGPQKGNIDDHYFTLAVRRTPDGLYLEVSSDYPDPARVKKDAESATGLPFEIIDVCAE